MTQGGRCDHSGGFVRSDRLQAATEQGGWVARVLLLATTTGYQTRAFGDAAERLGIDLIFGTDRCNMLEDPWQEHAIPIRFYDEPGAAATILEVDRQRPIDGIVAVGDRPTLIAALVSEGLRLPG